MSPRGASRPVMAPRTPHPHSFLRKSDRSDRPEALLPRPDALTWGPGETAPVQWLARHRRPERPERPEMRGHTCARGNRGSGGKDQPHALVGISRRSSRSGRDPPCIFIHSNGLPYVVSPVFRAVLFAFQAGQAVILTIENQHPVSEQKNRAKY